MKKKIIIEIIDDSVSLESENLKALTVDDISLCIKVLISLAKMMGVGSEEM